ncbi:NADPH-dependent F420 reductase [Salinispora sp. H7-4]|uniref:NADPH-dependent F420 reductase n=1 Tax=Salinispora sp. H7-4 TaxID=2748321 RepID=UPI0015D431F3|nr:NADP oxidoreductase [Salinispora sp. H7-4]NYT95311.1 NADP oxidoreductase [Salinispora sp. H7-4]
MTVGILGRGRMGRALAAAVRQAGGRVLLVPGRADPLQWGGLLAPAAVVVLAVPFPAAVEFLRGPAGGQGRGRTLVDPTNPVLCEPALVPPGRSGGELLAEIAADRAAGPGHAGAGWRVAKAFNTVPAGVLARSRVNGLPVSLPVATDHPAALREVSTLARALGFAPLDAGGVRAARHLEALTGLLMAVSDRQDLRGQVCIHIGVPGGDAVTRETACRAG